MDLTIADFGRSSKLYILVVVHTNSVFFLRPCLTRRVDMTYTSRYLRTREQMICTSSLHAKHVNNIGLWLDVSLTQVFLRIDITSVFPNFQVYFPYFHVHEHVHYTYTTRTLHVHYTYTTRIIIYVYIHKIAYTTVLQMAPLYTSLSIIELANTRALETSACMLCTTSVDTTTVCLSVR